MKKKKNSRRNILPQNDKGVKFPGVKIIKRKREKQTEGRKGREREIRREGKIGREGDRYREMGKRERGGAERE